MHIGIRYSLFTVFPWPLCVFARAKYFLPHKIPVRQRRTPQFNIQNSKLIIFFHFFSLFAENSPKPIKITPLFITF